jgi:hypothetical protein
MSQKIKSFLIGTENIQLEGEFFNPSTKNKTAILITHPHPEMGGTMHNNVVSGIFKRLVENNISCLRFNFVGVGKSKSLSSKKCGPIEQVKIAVDYLLEKEKIKKVIICGYSYGAAMGCSAIDYDDAIISYIAISFPWDFMGKDYKDLSQTEKPKLFIQGNRDSIADYHRFKDHYEFYNQPKDFEIIDGADHFYRGYEDRLAQLVIEFYEEYK